jgi:hypothetical protein
MLSTVQMILGIIVLFTLGFLAIWCGVCYGVALVARWPRLRELYAFDQGFEGKTTTFTGQVGVASYRRVLSGAATPVGLYLNVAAPFRLGAGPVLIPWQDILVSQPGSGPISQVTFDFTKADTRLRVSPGVASRVFGWQQGDN